jgi:dienelactone hydrolase
MDSLRRRIAEFINLTAIPAQPTAEVVARHVADGHVRSLLRYTVDDSDEIEAFLFEPNGRTPLGGVLVLHQHNSQWAFGKSEVAGLVGDSLQGFGPALARRGLCVLAPDTVGFESRLGRSHWDTSLAPSLTKEGSSPDGWLQYYNQMAHRLVYGDLLIRKTLSDCMAAVSVLRGVIPGDLPVGAVGHSMGGSLSLFLGALDTRIAFTCSSGAVGSYRYKRERGIGLEWNLVIPGFATQFEVADLLRCIAPRSLLVVSAEDDAASGDANDVVRTAQAAFQAANASERLSHVHVPGAHGLDQRRFDAIVEWAVSQTKEAG